LGSLLEARASAMPIVAAVSAPSAATFAAIRNPDRRARIIFSMVRNLRAGVEQAPFPAGFSRFTRRVVQPVA
jgi:hypothetical protein